MGIKFTCGHCGESIHEANSSFAFAGWQAHEKCGYETYFDKFVLREGKSDTPAPQRVRKIGDTGEDEEPGLPSAADLDADAEEKKLKDGAPATEKDGQELLADFENHKTDASGDEAADAKKAVEEHLNPPAVPSAE